MIPVINLDIGEGNDKTFNVAITDSETGSLFDITDYKFLFTVKANRDDPDSQAIISKDITVHTNAVSGLTTIDIDRADTIDFPGTQIYDYQWCASGSDDRRTIFGGKFTIKQAIGDRECP